jgi:predicted tellurium resistance membrane protein TerC
MFCSALVAMLMNKCPWLVLLGGAILGWVAGEMIVADKLVGAQIQSVLHIAQRTVPLLLAVAIVVIAKWPELTGRLRERRHGAAVKSIGKVIRIPTDRNHFMLSRWRAPRKEESCDA